MNTQDTSGNNAVVSIFGIVILAVVAILFFVYALPAIRGGQGNGFNVDVTLPEGMNGGGQPNPAQ